MPSARIAGKGRIRVRRSTEHDTLKLDAYARYAVIKLIIRYQIPSPGFHHNALAFQHFQFYDCVNYWLKREVSS